MQIRYHLAQLRQAVDFIDAHRTTTILRIDGVMGAGKTTLIKKLCEHWGVKDVISSPTFSLVNAYEGTNEMLYHFDFYRINTILEAYDMGVEEYLDSGAICLIEWGEKIESLLPTSYDHFNIRIASNEERLLVYLS